MKIVNFILKIYNDIPLAVVNIIAPLFYLIPIRYRYGSIFWKQYSSLISGKSLTERQRERCEIRLLRHKLIKAYEEIPFYRESFSKTKFNPYEFKSVDDLNKISMIDKADVQNKRENMIKNGVFKEELDYVTTSGTTGQPMGFYQDRKLIMREWAYVNYVWKRLGYAPDSSRLILRGKIFREKRLKGKCWQWDALKRELSIDVFAMTKENLRVYCDKIEKYKPQYVHGYMSAIMVLCHFIEQYGLKHSFSGVLAVSEPVKFDQRQYVEKILNTRVFSFYGHTERLVMAAECEYSTEYHIEPEYGFVELIDSEGKQIWEPGVRGEIVATGFLNESMPLIRYKTGDIAEWSEYAECACGRSHRRLKSVEGRWGDILLGKSGTKISITALNMHSRVYDNVIKYQFYQEKEGEVWLKVVPAEKFSESDIDTIKRELIEKVGDELNITIKIVEDIPVGANGKFSLINQKLKYNINNW